MTQQQSPASGRKETNGGDRDQAHEISNKTHEVADQVKQAALERVQSVRDRTQSAKQQAAERVRKLGSTVRKVGEHLRVEDQRYVAQKASDASQQLDKLADYLSSAQIGTMLRDTGELARANQAVFLGSAFVVGLAAGRFLKTGSSTATPDTSSPRGPELTRREGLAGRAGQSSAIGGPPPSAPIPSSTPATPAGTSPRTGASR
jgi:hypothetical protein